MEETEFSDDFVDVLQGIGGITVAYNLIAHGLNSIAIGLMGYEFNILPPVFDFWFDLFPWPFLNIFIVCCLVGVFTYWVIEWVCSARWIKIEQTIAQCFEIIVVVNPWTWFRVIFCIIRTICRMILVWICRWKVRYVTVLVWLCFIGRSYPIWW